LLNNLPFYTNRILATEVLTARCGYVTI